MTMSAIDKRNRRRKRLFVRLELEDARISEKFLRYLCIRMMTRTIKNLASQGIEQHGVLTYHYSKHL